MKTSETTNRDWPDGLYFHCACSDCGEQFTGPKRAAWCWLCEAERCLAVGKQKPEKCDCLNDSKEVIELKQRIQTLEAEVGRLEKLAYIGDHQFEDCTYKFRLEELRAQPARQVGGDEREETSND